MEAAPRPIHLLMRYSDRLASVEDTVAAHQDVIKKYGAVWFGKMGKTLGRGRVNALNEQCSRKIPTFLFLVQKGTKGYDVYRARLAEVSRTRPDNRNLIPAYYDKQNILNYMRLWQKVTSIRKLDDSVLNQLYIASSGARAADSLRQSMAALFVVRERCF